MAIVAIDDSDDEKLVLTLSNGDEIELVFEGDCVYAYAGGNEVGEFHFNCYDQPYQHSSETFARLTHAFLEGNNGRYMRQGVGTEAIRFFLRSTGYILELPEDDGIKKDDGSHLVQDGPAFVNSLRRKQGAGLL
ncbi:hypothetical protein [Noviluteimonas gilva]|uniref:Uncharacterized protein n=1 Tax=Noviluteimonas gilva TaxID=2682097 RepID=A0A7C9HWE6_9GAMM|nr:hypothetical protein [Lysobacter gilvus]MUV15158.1 hypothetical protein [Lysobacter gilvus]